MAEKIQRQRGEYTEFTPFTEIRFPIYFTPIRKKMDLFVGKDSRLVCRISPGARPVILLRAAQMSFFRNEPV